MDYVLQTRDVTKRFGGKTAVDRVSMNIRAGDIYGFIGGNGAGKTTLMRMVCGLAEPSAGEMSLFGSRDLEAGRYRMGCTIEQPALYPAMTAFENMEVQRLLLGVKDRKICMRLLEIVRLGDTGAKRARDFSLGMKQRLMIALALLDDPEFLVLDEPTNGLDPMGIKEMRDLFQRLNESRGTTILISSHILGELEKVATRYGIINNGAMVDEFRADELSLRCGKSLLIHTDEPDKAKEAIAQMFSDASFEQQSENALRLKGHTEDAGYINKRLVMAGITVTALIPEGESLENYFMRLMGVRNGGQECAI